MVKKTSNSSANLLKQYFAIRPLFEVLIGLQLKQSFQFITNNQPEQRRKYEKTAKIKNLTFRAIVDKLKELPTLQETSQLDYSANS